MPTNTASSRQQTGLLAIAARLEVNPWQRGALFACASLLSVGVIGYYFGTFDQSIHIPFLKAWSDPSLYANDPFVRLRFEQFSFFWFFFLPFYRLGVLEPVLFAVHLLTTYLTFHAIWNLSRTLFQNPLSSLFGVLAFIFPRVDLLGFPFIEFSLLSRTFVLPFQLLAIDLYLRGKRIQAFTLLGLLYNLHVLSVNYALALLLPLGLLQLLRSLSGGVQSIALTLRSLGAQMGVFLLAALPVLLWRLSAGHALDWSVRPDWLWAVGNGVLQHVFYLFAPHGYILLAGLGGLASLGLFYIARHGSPSQTHDLELHWMVAAGVGLLTVQFCIARWLPVTFLMELQLARLSRLLLLLSGLSFAHHLACSYQARDSQEAKNGAMTGAFLAAASPLFALIAWGILRLNVWRRGGRATVTLFTLATLAASVAGALITRTWSPGYAIYGPSGPWVEAQRWAKAHTAQEAVFITPPQLYSFYQPDWRVFSERASVATITDLFEIALLPEYLTTWQPRFEALAPGALQQFDGNVFTNLERVAQAYDSLSEANLLRVACTYGADYLVLQKPEQRAFPLVYENAGYRIYDLRPVKACGEIIPSHNITN